MTLNLSLTKILSDTSKFSFPGPVINSMVDSAKPFAQSVFTQTMINNYRTDKRPITTIQ